ncbi:hypothetical protein [[Eubacterium] cellulosolvens]
MTIKLSELPLATPLTGVEFVEVVQSGQSRRTTIADIQAPPQLQATYVTMTANPDLPNERVLTMGTGLQLSDAGPGLAVTLSVTTAILEPTILYDGASNPIATADPTGLTVTGITQSDRIIAGDPGTEASGIDLDGTTYLSSGKVSDIGGTNLAQFILHRHSTTIAPVVLSARANSDTDAHALVTDGQSLLWMIGAGHDGVAYQRAAEIEMEVDGTAAANDMPGRIIMSTTPAGTKVPVERMRISNEGSLYLSEIAAAGPDIAGKAQIFVRNDTPNVAIFRNDAGEEIELGSGGGPILSARLAYDSTVTSGDPGAGGFRLSSPTPSAATAMYVNDVDLDGIDMQAVMQQTAVGKLFRFANPADPEIFNEYRVTSYTDNTGWWTVGINYVQGTNTLPAATTECRFEWLTRAAIDAGAFSGNSADLAIWDKAGQDKWIGTGVALRVNTSSPSADGRLVLGSMTTTTTVNPYIKFELGNSDNTILFAQRLNNTQGYYQRANLNSTIDYRFGYRTGSVDTDCVRLTAADEFNIMAGGTLVFTERAAARAATAGEGELWVQNAAPNVLWFTDDDGTDWNLLDPGARATIISAGWSTSGGGSLTVGANAPLFYTEQATNDTPAAGQGQVWVRNDTPNTLMFTDDAGSDFELGGSLVVNSYGFDSFKYTYDSNTTINDPGPGNIRFNNAGGPASSTQFAIDVVDGDSNNIYEWMIDCWGPTAGAVNGILFRIVKADDPTVYAYGSINEASNISTLYIAGYVNWVESNGTFTNGDACFVQITPQPYVAPPTSAFGIYVGREDLGGQPLNGVLQSTLITHPLNVGTATLNFIQGGTYSITMNSGSVTTSGAAVCRHNASNRHEWYGATNILPRLQVTETSIVIGHGNDAGNGAPQLYMRERTSLTNPGTGWGGLAVLNSNPNQLWFIDDLNNTYNLTNPGAAAQTITAGWSTGSGGSFTATTGSTWTVDDNVPLYFGDVNDCQFLFNGTDMTITSSVGTFDLTLTDMDLQMNNNQIIQAALLDYAVNSTSYTPSGTTQTVDYTAGPAFEIDLEGTTGNITITLSNPPASGDYGQMSIKIQQDGASARTITWAGGTFRWPGGTAHPMNSTLDGISIYTFETWDGGTTWYGTGADYS